MLLQRISQECVITSSSEFSKIWWFFVKQFPHFFVLFSVITGSADKTLRVIDINSGFKPVVNMKATDAVFCL